jgi:GR25 family glycosyltransferase involved in LPS biosynthesis
MFPPYFLCDVVCINLDRRADRWVSCLSEFERVGLSPRRISAVDGRELPPHSKLLPGEVGCRASHELVLSEAASKSVPTLIFEDDVVFSQDASGRAPVLIGLLPSDWDIVYLGGNHVRRPHSIGLPSGIVRPTRIFTTGSYMVTPAGATRLLSAVKSSPDLQVDVAYTQARNVSRYAFMPPVAWQRPGYSDIQGSDVDYTGYMGI